MKPILTALGLLLGSVVAAEAETAPALFLPIGCAVTSFVGAVILASALATFDFAHSHPGPDHDRLRFRGLPRIAIPVSWKQVTDAREIVKQLSP